MPSDSPRRFPRTHRAPALPARGHIATLFTVLLLVAGLSIGGLAYHRSATMLTRVAADLSTASRARRPRTCKASRRPWRRSSISWRRPDRDRPHSRRAARHAGADPRGIRGIPGHLGHLRRVCDRRLLSHAAGAGRGRCARQARRPGARRLPRAEHRAQRAGGAVGTFVWLDAGLARLATENQPGVRDLRSAQQAVVPGGRQGERPDQDRALRVLHHSRGRRHARAPRRRESGHRRGYHLAGNRGGACAPADHAGHRDRAREHRWPGRRAPGRREGAAGRHGAGRGAAAGPCSHETGSPVLAALAGRLEGASGDARAAKTADIEAGGREWRTLVAPLPVRGAKSLPRLVLRGAARRAADRGAQHRARLGRHHRRGPRRGARARPARGECDRAAAEGAGRGGGRDPALRVLAAGRGRVDREGGGRARRNDGRDEAHDPAASST